MPRHPSADVSAPNPLPASVATRGFTVRTQAEIDGKRRRTKIEQRGTIPPAPEPVPVDGSTKRISRGRTETGMTTVRAAITQTTWTGDKESMLDKHEQFARDAAAQGAQVICFQELFYGPYFGITEDKKYYRYAEPADGPDRAALRGAGAGAEPGHDPPDLRGGHHRRVLQHGRRRRCRRHDPRQVPQAPPAAPRPVLGEVLLPPRQPRLPGVRHRGRQGRHLHLLRPALPRGMARARPERRAHRVQPERHQARPVEPALGGRGARARPSRTATSCCSPTGSDARTTSTASSRSTSTAPAR